MRIPEAHHIESASEVVRDMKHLRQDIELGWQQSESGELHAGPEVFAEIRALSKTRRAPQQLTTNHQQLTTDPP